MKESGINYFLGQLKIPLSSLSVFYTFEDGVGNNITSVPSGNSLYTGVLDQINDFWIIPGSGFFNGNIVTILNSTGLISPYFTHLISYEKATTGANILISNFDGKSGYQIGITDTNKIYFQTFNNEPIIATSYNNIGTKNLLSISYTTNHVLFGYYNFNSQTFETESFDYNFGNLSTNSNQTIIGLSYTGYMDYYLYFNKFYGDNILNGLASGFYNTVSGNGQNVTTFSYTGMTGYQTINYIQIGITGYITLPSSGSDGVGDFTGLFPVDNISVPLTGVIQTGLINSGVTGIINFYVTGSPTKLFNINTGYISSFGMEKIIMINTISDKDILLSNVSYKNFDDNYNIFLAVLYSGRSLNNIYLNDILFPYVNGLAQSDSGWYIKNNGLFITGMSQQDTVILDIISRNIITGNDIIYSGQQIFLNGLNLISGKDFTFDGNMISLINENTGVNGLLFDDSFVLQYVTGNNNVENYDNKFSRNTSMIYINGLRQLNYSDYIEGAKIDLMNGNDYNRFNNNIIYDNDNLYWDI